MATPKALLLAALCCACFFAAVLAARELSDDSAMVARHEQWMAQHGRVYKDDAEKARRFEVFKTNVKFIETFNAAGNRKFWLGVNQFADLTNDEFRATKTNKGFNPNAVKVPTGFRYANVSTDALPATVDWRTKGAVTPIKDQGQCGCCWAFSAVAAMEGIVKISTGKLISLSEQELVDCDVHGEDQGCNGGEMDDAFTFIIKNGGLTTESSYPYAAQDGQCKAGSNSAATIKGYEDVPANDEAALMKAVANQPVSVAVDGGDMTFQFYSGGVMTGSCGTDLDHGIAAIGYGTASDGTKYWLLKNSWGTTWGENGFLRMEKDISDKRGMCGLAMQPSYPTE
ncbi:senescence-specific cysteine protease SAG39 [Setaria viridis]|uniref:Peptidase C1A papain C-terminal domain-containing protein n=1 Tax=Setaria viridis TaxID=4556 RepID=A0A4U6TLP1_SETVI|nr:senescence-specific cysteine protease SAG39-like [Setaria viridis]TKW03460.1 hypothetical protein SEVIR_7G025500v2 [Setaria viridis]